MDNYAKSNSITTVSLNRFDKSYSRNFLNTGDSLQSRGKNAQALVDYLCDKFKIARCVVIIRNTAQPHSTNYNGKLKSKTHGLYYPATHTIILYNLTAMRKQTVSIKELYGTLLHEFIHHYDTTKLSLKSIHSKGFYARIDDLQNKITA